MSPELKQHSDFVRALAEKASPLEKIITSIILFERTAIASATPDAKELVTQCATNFLRSTYYDLVELAGPNRRTECVEALRKSVENVTAMTNDAEARNIYSASREDFDEAIKSAYAVNN